MNAMKAILEGIESQEDYDRVKEELESSKARLQELGEQLEKLDITDEEKMESSREYSPQMLQALLEIGTASIKAVEFGFTLEAPAAGL